MCGRVGNQRRLTHPPSAHSDAGIPGKRRNSAARENAAACQLMRFKSVDRSCDERIDSSLQSRISDRVIGVVASFRSGVINGLEVWKSYV